MKFALDISPLKKYRELRLLFTSGMITRLGSAMTMVALPFQIKILTNSYVAVGLMGLVQLAPLIIFGLYGGVLADAIDRKKMILIAEAASLVMTLALFLNALLPNPHVILLYIVGAAFAGLNGIAAPSLGAILPRIVKHEDMSSANALMGLRWQVGAIVGPSMCTIYEVGTTKRIQLEEGTRNYISVDGGMSDNIRPALYGAQYEAHLANRKSTANTELSRVVGKHCETGDILIRDIQLPSDINPGDLLAIPATGAYNRSMASNYNHVPRPPVIAVKDGSARVIVRRESYQDLLNLDV